MTACPAVARTLLAFVFVALLSLAAPVAADDDDSLEKVRTQSKEALARLYAANPAAREVIASSRGYATFSRWGLKIGPVGGGIGKGLLVERPSGKETLMRFVEGSAGLGLGIKKFDLIFVFQTDAAIKQFSEGWEAGGQATVAAKNGGTGKGIDGAASVAPGVFVYQNTDKGLVAEVGIKGTRYYKDTD